MSMTLIFEGSSRISTNEVLEALSSIDGVELEQGENWADGYLAKSNASFELQSNLKEECVLTEGAGPMPWLVGSRVYFRVDITRENWDEDVKAFALKLSDLSNGDFLISFEYATVWALHDSDGLHFT